MAKRLRTKLEQGDTVLEGWPLSTLPAATIAQLLVCPWWNPDTPRTWTWRIYHTNQPLGRWSSVGSNGEGTLAAGPCPRALPSVQAIRTALSPFKSQCKHGASDQTGLPDHFRKALKALERWAGIAYEQEAGRMLLLRLYVHFAIPSELGGMRHHLGWGHPRFSFQGKPVAGCDARLTLSADHPLFIHLWVGGGLWEILPGTGGTSVGIRTHTTCGLQEPGREIQIGHDPSVSLLSSGLW